MWAAVEAGMVEVCGGGLKFEGSLRSSCEVSNGDVLLRDTLSSSQEETM